MSDLISEFSAWWMDDRQAELRKSCAEGWAYDVWKASRESLVIELPKRCSEQFGAWREDAEGRILEYSQTVKAINAAGIKTK